MGETPLSRAQVARNLAVEMHGDQRRMDSGRKAEHVLTVGGCAAVLGEHAEIVGYLHDTLEDTGLSSDVILGMFGSRVLHDVHALTRVEGEPYDEYVGRVIRAGYIPMRVKLFDLADNLREPEGGNERWERELRPRYLRAAQRILIELRYSAPPTDVSGAELGASVAR